MTQMTPEIRKTFKAAGIDTDVLTPIPGRTIHPFMVEANAWLDEDQCLLMFVGTSSDDMTRFMYYIGEERNRAVVGVGRGIVAWQLSEERVEWLLDQIRLIEKVG